MTDTRTYVADRAAGLATGSIFLGLAVSAIQVRMDGPWSDGALFALAAGAFAIAYILALAGPMAFDRPAVPASVLIVVALLLAVPALLQLARVLGADDVGASGTVTWISAAFAVLAAIPAMRRNSAIATLLCAGGIGGIVLAGADWLFDLQGELTFRYLLAGLFVLFFLAGLSVGGSRPRHGVVLVDAAGLAAAYLGFLLTGLFILGGLFSETPNQGWGWQLAQLLAGLALAAYAATNREPGPGYLGALVLVQFLLGAAISFDSSPSITGWPLALLIMGAVVLAATLRPRRRT